MAAARVNSSTKYCKAMMMVVMVMMIAEIKGKR
jgi:hypothetical protein